MPGVMEGVLGRQVPFVTWYLDVVWEICLNDELHRIEEGL